MNIHHDITVFAVAHCNPFAVNINRCSKRLLVTVLMDCDAVAFDQLLIMFNFPAMIALLFPRFPRRAMKIRGKQSLQTFSE